MTLREAISEYCKWVVAVYLAMRNKHIQEWDALFYINDLRDHFTDLVGKELLDKKL